MKFPKTLYVAIENTGSGSKEDEFLNAQSYPQSFAEAGEVRKVARYQLVEVGTVTAEPIFVPGRKVR